MTLTLASRIGRIKPSATLGITAKAKEMRATGKTVISFSAGEPDFATPAHIRAHACEQIKGAGSYTSVKGRTDLLEAIAKDTESSHGIAYDPATEILVSCGAKHSIFNALMALVDPGDEVVIISPYWVSYPEMVKVCGGTPVIVETTGAEDFQPSADALRSALSDKTKALILNTPGNPSGALYSETTLRTIAEATLGSNIAVLSDEIYRHLTYEGKFQSILHIEPKLRDQTLLVDGVSKAYAMTGWRIGYTQGPAAVIGAMAKLQGQSTSNPTHIAQVAATAALRGDKQCIADMHAAYAKRRELILGLLRDIEGVTCPTPKGAFYAFPNFSTFLGKKGPSGAIETDVDLCNYLLDSAGVATVPGSAFGAPGHLRLSYACSDEDIKQGLSLLRDAVAKLS